MTLKKEKNCVAAFVGDISLNTAICECMVYRNCWRE